MEKILVIQTAFIGDAVLTLPMIQKLKALFSESEIDVLAIPSTSEIFHSSPYVNQVVVLDKRGKHKSIFSLLKFIKEIKKNNYTKIYSPHRSFRTSLIVMNLGVDETFGFSNSIFKHVYKHVVEYDTGYHEVQRNLDLIGYDHKNDWRILPEVAVPKSSGEKVEKYLNDFALNGRTAAIAPGSIWNTKVYPSMYFEEVIDFLSKRSFKIFLIGSEKEKSLCQGFAEKFKDKVVNTAGQFSLIDTIEFLKKMNILISNDSAPTHLGMCADVPVLTLYCSTIPDFGFFPYNNGSSFLSYDDLDCKPCGIHGYEQCPIKTFACGYQLKPEVVISKIMEMLNVND